MPPDLDYADIVADWPALTDEQRDNLALLVRPAAECPHVWAHTLCQDPDDSPCAHGCGVTYGEWAA